ARVGPLPVPMPLRPGLSHFWLDVIPAAVAVALVKGVVVAVLVGGFHLGEALARARVVRAVILLEVRARTRTGPTVADRLQEIIPIAVRMLRLPIRAGIRFDVGPVPAFVPLRQVIPVAVAGLHLGEALPGTRIRSEEHTSELQSREN